MAPGVAEEHTLRAAGHRRIAGLDEVGRGCWAGPVVAAAVVLPQTVLDAPDMLSGVDDSKVLSAAERERLATQITALAEGWAIGAVPAHVIDTHGILVATRIAMQVALLRLPHLPDALLIDAVHLHGWPCTQHVFVRGDARCLSIAAASIVAKVARDRLMETHGHYGPDYGFARHKGYGTAQHERALHAHGLCDQHRRTFRPIVDFVQTGVWPPSHRLDSHAPAEKERGTQ